MATRLHAALTDLELEAVSLLGVNRGLVTGARGSSGGVVRLAVDDVARLAVEAVRAWDARA